jgi:hypothetical protein
MSFVFDPGLQRTGKLVGVTTFTIPTHYAATRHYLIPKMLCSSEAPECGIPHRRGQHSHGFGMTEMDLCRTPNSSLSRGSSCFEGSYVFRKSVLLSVQFFLINLLTQQLEGNYNEKDKETHKQDKHMQTK